jgi:hypothetical protein
MSTVASRLARRWPAISVLVTGLDEERFLLAAESLHAMSIEKFIQLTPAKRAQLRRDVAAAARRLILEVDDCDKVLQHGYPGELDYVSQAFREELIRVGQLDHGLPRRFDKSGPRGDHTLKLMAASKARQMLLDLDIKPVTTRKEKWTTLTAHLFFVVTGRRCKDAQRVCIAVKKSQSPLCSG